MIKHLTPFLVAGALAACGGSKHTPVTPPTEGSGSATQTATSTPDAAPATDTKPVEPPKVDPEKQKADLAAAETAAYDKAKPVFEKYCASCHTKAGKKSSKKKLDHFSMDTYPFGGEHTKSIGNEVRVVLGIDGGKKPTMPYDKPGSVQGDDLAAIKAWTEAWQASGAAGNHPAEPAEKDDD